MKIRKISFVIALSIVSACQTRQFGSLSKQVADKNDTPCLDYDPNGRLDAKSEWRDDRLESWLAQHSEAQRNFDGVTFGLEVELSIQANPRLLCDFRPANIFPDQWQNLTFSEKTERASQWVTTSKKAYYRGDPTFLKIDGRPAPAKELHAEPTGMLEFRGFVFGDLVDLAKTLRGMERSYGPGQIQGHVVFQKRQLPGLAGYTIYESDRALLTTLAEEYEAFTSKKRPPSGHFVSSFLKPMDSKLFSQLKTYEKDISPSWSYTLFHKFIAAPVLRGGGLYGSKEKIGFEMRQWDFPSVGVPALGKRAGHLVLSLDRLANHLASNEALSKYSPYAELEVLDGQLRKRVSEAAAQEVAEEALLDLEQRIRKAVHAMPYTKRDDMDVVDPGIRFLYPFRDWSSYVEGASLNEPARQDIRKGLQKSTQVYAKRYSHLAQSTIEGDDLLGELRVALALWARDSKLRALFD